MISPASRPDLPERVQQAAGFLSERLRESSAAGARVAVILGSGLGGAAEQLVPVLDLAYRDIPHFPGTSVEGHRGRFLAGDFGGVPAVVLEGRVHGYEGHPAEDTTFAVRLMSAIEIKTIVVTNAAGAIASSYMPGDLVAISDHINLTGVNPVSGIHDDRLGPRFFDMTRAYDPQLRAIAMEAARQQGWTMAEGVYLGVEGPSFETPAEIRAFRALGADLVGMSTVHEVIAARQCALRVLAISCVTNMAAGVIDRALGHGEVMETSAAASGRLGGLLAAILPQLAAFQG